MRVSALLALLIVCTTVASAQEYPATAPVPRTTAAPALRASAVKREINARFEIALAAQARGQWHASAAELRAVLALAPPEPQGSTAHYDLALAEAHLGRNDRAAREFVAALKLDPGFLAAMANLIAVDLARHDPTDARAVADRFVALAPDSARALYSRGIVALRTGDAAAARADFGKLLRNDPRYALAHYDLALAEEHLGNYRDAEGELRAALALAPGYVRARLSLGVVLLREGETADARSAFAAVTHADDPALANLAAAMLQSI